MKDVRLIPSPSLAGQSVIAI